MNECLYESVWNEQQNIFKNREREREREKNKINVKDLIKSCWTARDKRNTWLKREEIASLFELYEAYIKIYYFYIN